MHWPKRKIGKSDLKINTIKKTKSSDEIFEKTNFSNFSLIYILIYINILCHRDM